MFTSLSPMLYTRQLKETIDYYREILEFHCPVYEPDWGWAAMEHGSIRIMLSLPNDHLPFIQPGFTGSFYFTMDTVDLYYEKIRDRVKLCYPLEDFPYGMREFAFWDNNGYLLQFGADLSSTDR